MDVLFEDDHLLVINKPAGVVTEGPARQGRESLAALLSGETSIEVHPCHRLDKDTTGAIIFAKTSGALKSMSRQFADRKVRKSYWTCVAGEWNPSWNRIETRIERRPGGTIKLSPQGKTARTTFRRLAYWNNRSLLEALPKTGRRHQIRLHCLDRKRPVLGDGLYGCRNPQDPPLALHAAQLRFLHPATGEPLTLNAPLPDYWHEFWLRGCPLDL